MKRLILITLLFTGFIRFSAEAQETYGKTFNLGIGVGGYSGYYKYAGPSLPVFHVDYEFDVAKDFTLAPFVNVYTYTDEYYWGDNNNPHDYYTYNEVVIPIGVKGAYYFDDLLQATGKWDFYLAGSLGFALVNSKWEDGYNGDEKYYHGGRSVFLDLHIGTEYHFNNKIGAFLDLSSGVSTIGLAFHGTR